MRCRTYARAPVEFVRGEGARLWDAEGRSTSTSSPGSRSTTPATATRGSSPRSRAGGALAGVSNLYYTEPAMRLCERLAESSLGGKVFLCNSGAEANECAIKLARKRAHRAGIAGPRSSSSTAPFTAARSARSRRRRSSRARTCSGRCRPGFVAVPRDDPDALRAAVGERTAAVMHRADPGRGGGLPDRRRGAARRARGVRRGRRAARLRRDPVRDGADRDRCGPTSSSPCART